jgi:hypothetical protein
MIAAQRSLWQGLVHLDPTMARLALSGYSYTMVKGWAALHWLVKHDLGLA